ncbi:hypothetical protein J6N69_03930 [bacterium]|nr:hypothetical protein [bacterium]
MQIYELNTARNCLRIIIRTYGIKEIFIPYYVCPTIWQACRKEHCAVKFYHIDNDFYPVTAFDKNAYILYPNYFGINFKNVLKLSSIYPNLIVDNAHAAYMGHIGLTSFSSYRKFFNVSDGAKLFINKEIKLPKDTYTYNEIPKNYNDFIQNEIRLNNEEPKFINDTSKNIIKHLDLEAERARRLEKFSFYDKKYCKINEIKIELSKQDVPFVYPLLCENEIETDILLFRYWDSLPKDFPEYRFYKYLKPIPLLEEPFRKQYL